MTNLTRLALYDLEGLYLGKNALSDISALSGLTNLIQLWLKSNNISDISPLVANTGLGSGNTVDAWGNPLSDESINTHIPALQSRGVNVQVDTPVNIPNRNLRAAIERALGKAVGDLITTTDMKSLTTLKAFKTNISNLTGLEYATNLTELSLDDNSILDISALSGLSNLTHLWLPGNSLSDLSALSKLTHLTTLGLGTTTSQIFQRCRSSDNALAWGQHHLSALSKLTHLTTLGLAENRISDISAVSGLSNLKSLYLNDNRISDISAMAGLTKLTGLFLGINHISDLSPLSGLPNLIDLSLDGNNISDLAPLVSNTGLKIGAAISVIKNPLNAASINTHIPALQSRSVSVRFE